MYEIIFLLVLGFLWVLFATFQDLKVHEVSNWLNFSLIIFALGFRFFYGLFENSNQSFFGIFFVFLISFFILIIIIFFFEACFKKYKNEVFLFIVVFVFGCFLLFLEYKFQFIFNLFLQNGFEFLYFGVLGLVIFFLIGNLFYYSKLFAGGDAKLMAALGPILLFSNTLSFNLKNLGLFLILFFFVGMIYSLLVSFYFCFKNFKSFKKDFLKRLKSSKKLVYVFMIPGLLFMVVGFKENMLFILGILLFILPYVYLFAKSIDEVCMIKKIKTGKLTEGDWLYKKLKIGNKIIEANWNGLTKDQINLIKTKKEFVLIRIGIPYVPTFLISFVLFIAVEFFGFLENLFAFLN
ncbi:MAG: prepilin peptidase [Nanoarchaeota archaeon]|nr:prepilin peptidase [Nanoarchaeota archaeon]